MAKYDDGTEVQKGDIVHGIHQGEKVAGKVFCCNADGTCTVERQGPAVMNDRFRKAVRGKLEQITVQAEDLTLIYRKGA